MQKNHATGIRWDLKDLYSSIQDPQIEKDLNTADSLAGEFEKKYKPFLENPDKTIELPLAGLLKDYKKMAELMARLGALAHLSFAEDTQNAAAGAFMQKTQVRLTDIGSHLIFFGVGWNRLDENTVSELLKKPGVQPDVHFLQKLRLYASHTLAEGEEKIMSIKSNTGGNAFSRLFDETLNSIPFFIEERGQRVQKTEGEVLSLFHSSDRGVRKMASDSLAEGLEKNTRLLTYIFNMVLADHRSDLKIRNFKHPMDPMNLSNEIKLESVMNLIASVKETYPLAARYYKLKKRLLGLDKLYDYDRYAHLDEDGAEIPFEECRRIVLEGYRAFSERAGKITEQFFEKRWIDAEVRAGKQGGGFCCATTPEIHPYILVNYTGNLRDVMTVAHELGHGLHQTLAANVGILEADASLTLAETASVFGEMLIFDRILSEEKDPKKKLSLICGKIDDNFATVFRQIAMTDFELRAHEAGLKQGELPHERLSEIWIGANADLYGQSVELTPNYRHGWKYIPHFVHSPFYCYAYAFAQLFVLCLYEKYKEDRQAFLPAYFEMLSLGGSRKPAEIASIAGLNIDSKDFWKTGIRFLENLVVEAENLAKAQ